jgi:hypothetical protein
MLDYSTFCLPPAGVFYAPPLMQGTRDILPAKPASCGRFWVQGFFCGQVRPETILLFKAFNPTQGLKFLSPDKPAFEMQLWFKVGRS